MRWQHNNGNISEFLASWHVVLDSHTAFIASLFSEFSPSVDVAVVNISSNDLGSQIQSPSCGHRRCSSNCHYRLRLLLSLPLSRPENWLNETNQHSKDNCFPGQWYATPPLYLLDQTSGKSWSTARINVNSSSSKKGCKACLKPKLAGDMTSIRTPSVVSNPNVLSKYHLEQWLSLD